MSHNDTVPLYQSSQSDIDEIENMMSEGFQSGPGTVLPLVPRARSVLDPRHILSLRPIQPPRFLRRRRR
ncbi:hypothetical protein Bca52824_092751 [Brassica carinata]|uniref:Uncharacterized protein n=1 Tax=Brassica carinata TaxID=52824 RepID=A0A8X7P5X2_BRACI|nr:hypothetical protein Bca52824_092751 [Brassica carinata]